VAEHAGQQALAEAFEGADAVVINEKAAFNGYENRL